MSPLPTSVSNAQFVGSGGGGMGGGDTKLIAG